MSADRDSEFVAFVSAHRPALVRTARLLAVGDPAAAEDLVQTALTKAYVHWTRVRSADQPLAYVHRILATTAIDEGRRGHRRREVATADLPEPTGPAHGRETRDIVLHALAALPPRQRAVVVLRHWLDYSVDRTAELLGISAGTVKSHNARALATLHELLDDLELTPDTTSRRPR